jgi:predicted nucleic acid-binding protein
MPAFLVDAGPLTALLNPNDRFHAWTRDAMRRLKTPLLTSEPVLTEALHLLRRDGCEADELFALAEDGIIKIGLRFDDEHADLRELWRVTATFPCLSPTPHWFA